MSRVLLRDILSALVFAIDFAQEDPVPLQEGWGTKWSDLSKLQAVADRYLEVNTADESLTPELSRLAYQVLDHFLARKPHYAIRGYGLEEPYREAERALHRLHRDLFGNSRPLRVFTSLVARQFDLRDVLPPYVRSVSIASDLWGRPHILAEEDAQNGFPKVKLPDLFDDYEFTLDPMKKPSQAEEALFGFHVNLKGQPHGFLPSRDAALYMKQLLVWAVTGQRLVRDHLRNPETYSFEKMPDIIGLAKSNIHLLKKVADLALDSNSDAAPDLMALDDVIVEWSREVGYIESLFNSFVNAVYNIRSLEKQVDAGELILTPEALLALREYASVILDSANVLRRVYPLVAESFAEQADGLYAQSLLSRSSQSPHLFVKAADFIWHLQVANTKKLISMRPLGDADVVAEESGPVKTWWILFRNIPQILEKEGPVSGVLALASLASLAPEVIHDYLSRSGDDWLVDAHEVALKSIEAVGDLRQLAAREPNLKVDGLELLEAGLKSAEQKINATRQSLAGVFSSLSQVYLEPTPDMIPNFVAMMAGYVDQMASSAERIMALSPQYAHRMTFQAEELAVNADQLNRLAGQGAKSRRFPENQRKIVTAKERIVNLRKGLSIAQGARPGSFRRPTLIAATGGILDQYVSGSRLTLSAPVLLKF